MKDSDKLLKTILAQPMSKQLLAMILKWALEVDNQWISTSERFPEHDNNVLCVLKGKVHVMACTKFNFDGAAFRAWAMVYDGLHGDAERDDNYHPTHWMEIPKPPKNNL